VRLFLCSYCEASDAGLRQRIKLVHDMHRGVCHIMHDLTKGWQRYSAHEVANFVLPNHQRKLWSMDHLPSFFHFLSSLFFVFFLPTQQYLVGKWILFGTRGDFKRC
jgi:hypothetical protein